MADLKTFLGYIDTTTPIVVTSLEDMTNLKMKAGALQALIYDPEIGDEEVVTKRLTYQYTVELIAATNSALETAIEKLRSNISDVMMYTAVGAYTKPAKLAKIFAKPLGRKIKRDKRATSWHYITQIQMTWEN